jgi:hypothetical protein
MSDQPESDPVPFVLSLPKEKGQLLHSALKPCAQLEAEYKENNRQAVRAIPDILREAGLSIGSLPATFDDWPVL